MNFTRECLTQSGPAFDSVSVSVPVSVYVCVCVVEGPVENILHREHVLYGAGDRDTDGRVLFDIAASMCVCACVCACVHACMHACVSACVRMYVLVCTRTYAV